VAFSFSNLGAVGRIYSHQDSEGKEQQEIQVICRSLFRTYLCTYLRNVCKCVARMILGQNISASFQGPSLLCSFLTLTLLFLAVLGLEAPLSSFLEGVLYKCISMN